MDQRHPVPLLLFCVNVLSRHKRQTAWVRLWVGLSVAEQGSCPSAKEIRRYRWALVHCGACSRTGYASFLDWSNALGTVHSYHRRELVIFLPALLIESFSRYTLWRERSISLVTCSTSLPVGSPKPSASTTQTHRKSKMLWWNNRSGRTNSGRSSGRVCLLTSKELFIVHTPPSLA